MRSKIHFYFKMVYKASTFFREVKYWQLGIRFVSCCSWKIQLVSFATGHRINEDQSPIIPRSQVICDLQNILPYKEKGRQERIFCQTQIVKMISFSCWKWCLWEFCGSHLMVLPILV